MIALPDYLEVVETVDGRWMVLENGFQRGGHIDRSGAGDLTYATKAEALADAQGVCSDD